MADRSETQSSQHKIIISKTASYSMSRLDVLSSPDKEQLFGGQQSRSKQLPRSELSGLEKNVAEYVRTISREKTTKSLVNLMKQLNASVGVNALKKRESLDETLGEESDSTPSTETKSTTRAGKTETTPKRNPSVINLSSCNVRIVRDVVRKLGIKESTGITRDWDVYWSSGPISVIKCKMFMKHQRTNHFPESSRPLLKNNLAKYLRQMQLRFPQQYNFFPETWCLPEEFLNLKRYAQKHPTDWFIVKPHNCCSGHGIFLTNDLCQLADSWRPRRVCQIYIQRPLLIDNFKFDLRIYVLVTSCKPLRIFAYNEGFVRFATEIYKKPNRHNERRKRMHLTNYCVNRNSPNCIIDDENGTLRRLSTFSKWLSEHGFDTKNVWDSVDDIIVKTTITVTPILCHNYYSSFPEHIDTNSCFQIFGYDIMFDENLKPYLLEVNADPSLYSDIHMERILKEELVRDTFIILNLTAKTKKSSPVITSMKKSVVEKLKWENDRKLTLNRIEWEDSHMGNYRKVYPNDVNKCYEEFLKSAEAIDRSF